MLLLAVRTDKPQAELALYDNQQLLSQVRWEAHRQLAETIHQRIRQLLADRPADALQGIVVYQGPGSFTGLRIGLSVANAMAYGLQIPIVASQGKGWQATGVKRLLAGQNDQLALPEYGADPNVTTPRK